MITNKEEKSISNIIEELKVLLDFSEMMVDVVAEISDVQSHSKEKLKLIFRIVALNRYSQETIKTLIELNSNEIRD